MSMQRFKSLAMIAAACATFSAHAAFTVHAAPTITFDSFDPTSVTGVSNYVENGFQLSGDNLMVLGGTWNAGYSTGSNSMLSNTGNGRITLTKAGGGAFSFNSIDVSELYNQSNLSATNVHFVADLAGGGTADYTVDLDLVFGYQAVDFGGTFNNVTSVSWLQTASYHQFDNLVMGAATAVPEPASIALVGLALAAVGAARRRAVKRA